MSDRYDLLGVQPGAEPEVVEAAYRALMKKYHPDRWQGSADEATERAQEINAAYTEIKARGAMFAVVPDADTNSEAPTVVPTPALRTGQSLARALIASAAILAVMAIIATS